MNDDLIWAMVPIISVISIAAAIILRPLTKQLGQLIELQGQKSRDRSATKLPADSAERLTSLLESLDGRLEALENRMETQERRLDATRDQDARRLAEPSSRPTAAEPGDPPSG